MIASSELLNRPSNVCYINPLNAKLNLICHLLVLLGAHHIFHVSGLRVNAVVPSVISLCIRSYKLQQTYGRSQWPRGLRCRSTAARLLSLWVRIPPGTWMSVCCECCVLSGRGLCNALITRPEESYRTRWVVLCDLESSRIRRPWPALGRSTTKINLWPHQFTEIPNILVTNLLPLPSRQFTDQSSLFSVSPIDVSSVDMNLTARALTHS